MSKTHYVTTALPYVNASPHVGFAFELILADTLARHRRSRGDAVRLVAGTDENSLKNVTAAEAHGTSPESWVASRADEYRRLAKTLELEVDDFVRTSADPRHRPAVERIWRACARAGDLYRGRYTGHFCPGCEQFFAPDELASGRCPEHGATVESIVEENWFFRLSRHAERLRAAIEDGSLRIEPRTRRAEVLAWLRDGLRDVSVSRPASRARGWGIPVPDDPSQVVYVWLDALTGYLSALDFGRSERQGAGEDAYRTWWRESDVRCHVIGKGITRFHALLWPAVLLSAGLPLPTTLFVHGYVTAGGVKISKSAGASPSPAGLAEELGADSLRYHLLRHLRAGQDGDFRREDWVRAHDEELADQLGNLVARVAALLVRHGDGRVPRAVTPGADEARVAACAESVGRDVGRAIDEYRLHDGLAAVWSLVAELNRYVERTAPWRAAAAGDSVRFATTLNTCLEGLSAVAQHLDCFLPATAARIPSALGLPDARGTVGCAAWGALPVGAPLALRDGARPVLFPRVRR